MQYHLTPKDIERFWSKVHKTDDCWLWTGPPNVQNGYGYFYVARHMHSAHRIAYCLAHGSIPDRLHVLHSCPRGHNRLCVNPAHLYAGTNTDNIHDAQREGTAYNLPGERHPRAKLTDNDIVSIRALLAQGVSARRVASMYGIAHQTVSQIKHRRRWAHVP